jgi:hypothetical protein
LHEHVHEYSTAGTLGSRTKVIKKSSNTEKEKTGKYFCMYDLQNICSCVVPTAQFL